MLSFNNFNTYVFGYNLHLFDNHSYKAKGCCIRVNFLIGSSSTNCALSQISLLKSNLALFFVRIVKKQVTNNTTLIKK